MVSILKSRAFRVCAAALLAVFLGLLAAPAFAKPLVAYATPARGVIVIHDDACSFAPNLNRAQIVTTGGTVEICAGSMEGKDEVVYIVLVAPPSGKQEARIFAAIPASYFKPVKEA